jgi:hypothetical protein
MEKTLTALTDKLQSRRISRRSLVIAFLLIVLLLLLVLIGLIIYNHLHEKAINDRPLVLIQAPEKSDYIQSGIDVIVHATARSENGIARIELWVNDALVAAEDTAEEELLSLAVLNSNWLPIAPGPQTLVVRAVSNSGVSGQATRIVHAYEGLAEEHVDEDDTTTAGGSDSGTPEEEAGGGPDSGGFAPDLGDAPPGSGDDLLELIGDDSPGPEPEASAEGGEPTGVKAEILALETMESYEGLHCYVSFGESDDEPSQWYPDTDHDQSTDEDFPSSDGRNWEVEEYLSGDAVPTIMWPEDQALAINITCVGTAGDGMLAPELGRINLIRPPGTWDGVPRQATSEGGEGTYTVTYRIYKDGEAPREYFPIDIDRTMTSPTNLDIMEMIPSHRSDPEIPEYQLIWDYEPREDEDPIEGFIIYLNDTLQWIADPDQRLAEIPSQWVQPPCGVAYVFKVSALIGDPVSGRESPPSNEVTRFSANPGEEGCEEQYLLTFHTLVTDTLEIGSINGDFWGAFYTNGQILSFDGRCHSAGRGTGTVCGETPLYENWEYDLDRIMSALTGEPAQFILTPGDENGFRIGYSILTKYARHSESKERTGICHSQESFSWDEIRSWVIHEGRLDSEGPDDNFCHVYYTIEPIYTVGGPAVPPGASAPLPRLLFKRLYIDEDGQFSIDVQNTGYADWTAAIPIDFIRYSGELLESVSIEVIPIAPGATRKLIWDGFDPTMLPEVCVVLDPENIVPEYSQGDGLPESECFHYPNLYITDATYDTEDFEIDVHIFNQDRILEDYDLTVQFVLSDGNFRDVEYSGLRSDQRFELEISHLPRDLRELMLEGYTVTIDPYNEILESNEDDNTYSVSPATRLRLDMVAVDTYYYPHPDYMGDLQTQTFTLSLAKSPFERRYRNPDLEHERIGELTASEEIDYLARSGPSEGELLDMQEFFVSGSTDFTMAGDEILYIQVLGSLAFGTDDPLFLGGGSYHWNVWGDYGATRTIAEADDCHTEDSITELYSIDVQPRGRWGDIGLWRIYYRICRIE